jgi:hypothetical protein
LRFIMSFSPCDNYKRRGSHVYGQAKRESLIYKFFYDGGHPYQKE